MKMPERTDSYFDGIKEAAIGRCGEIIGALTSLPSSVITKDKADHPCPICEGKTVLYPDDRDGGASQHGRLSCRNCTNGKPTGDIIDTVRVFGGHSKQGEAAKVIASYLGFTIDDGDIPKLDIIEQVAKAKRMPVDAFRMFGPEIAKRGRDKKPVARVPVYNEDGEIHSHFDLTPSDKGFFKRGEGCSGMFFPGRLPKPGETWCLVEGVKDASALVGLGFDAAGLPNASMNRKYADLFRGVNVILVADLDKPGQHGSQVSGGNLFGIAASVRCARLPGEVVETKGDDVRDVIRRDGADTVRSVVENAIEWQPRDGNPSKDERPEVTLTLRYAWHVDQVVGHLGRLGWGSKWLPREKQESRKLYQRGGQLVEVAEEVKADATTKGGKVAVATGTPRIRQLPSQQLTLRIADACQLLTEKVTRDGDIDVQAVPPPKWLVDGVHTLGGYGDAVRPLESIITAPTIRPDGSLLQKPGWDSSGLLFRPSMNFDPIPENPTQRDASEACVKLISVVADFPFKEPCDESAWLAMLLSMIGRPCIIGQVPLFAISANVPGAGKSLQVDVASIIAYGHTAARTAYASEDDEMRKRITSIAIEGSPAVLLDNIDRPIGGAAIDAALTGSRWKDRELNTSRTIDLPMRCVWAATGNNLAFRADIARRVIPIRLDSSEENPEDRTDFTRADLIGWTHEHRAELVTAALTVLRAYFVAGCPKQDGGAFGSFESWSDTVRGAIVWAGLDDPLNTRVSAKEDDQSSAIVAGLIGGLIEVGGGTVREIIDQMLDPANADCFPTLRAIVSEVASRNGKPDARLLGNQLRKYRGRYATIRFDGERSKYRIEHKTGHARQKSWFASGDSGDCGDSSSSPPTYGKSCVSPHDTGDTHIGPQGDASEVQSPESPESPNKPCPKCGGPMKAGPTVGNWVNWDCSRCDHVTPERVAPLGANQ